MASLDAAAAATAATGFGSSAAVDLHPCSHPNPHPTLAAGQCHLDAPAGGFRTGTSGQYHHNHHYLPPLRVMLGRGISMDLMACLGLSTVSVVEFRVC